MEIKTKQQKKTTIITIVLTEIWPCCGEGDRGEEMALKGNSLFPNIQTQKLFRCFLFYNLAPM